ncbi:MAG: hypothetical protein DMG04_28015 [Acidobacteria bacterium]|nr:MAG: hypothetical protein DMG01_29125 [Acidobacteriota bacterium]PYQ69519.1 MAG: hypothetical protein DMG04_28015 [Acidobacteriota bacterium]PYQ87815.1 MAG: hypothetical protein DMG02_19425 [Acidobacteriota bacterium]PYR03471.1 MAG: hypothetical protein DMG00_26145 [Acidobacteriota bacterium]PYR07730.1 MAG: hypothetical protein DMF99_21540 [Acidobacteriota bacterium]
MMMKVLAFTLATAALVTADQTYPGQPTQAKVWIQNHGRSEVVPVSLQEAASDTQLKVQVSGTPNVQIVNGVDARLVRQTWQYSRVVIGSGQDPIVELNKAGADGWETTGLQLTESRGVAYVLKRPR